MREVNARQNDSNRPLSPQDPGGSGTPPQTEEPPSGLEKLRCALLGTELDRPHAEHLTAVDPRAPHRDGYVVWPPRPKSLGISCSGGGIRSASYNLGALQQLRGAGLLENPASGGADYLAAVSGGAYAAVAHTITAGFSEDSVFDTLPPWAAGSPEEQRLRNHADYLAPGFWGKVWALMNAAVGLGMNLLPFLLVLVMVGNLLGWSYWKLAAPPLGPPDGKPDPFAELLAQYRWWIVFAVLAPGFLLLYFRKMLDFFRTQPSGLLQFLQHWAPVLFVLGAASVTIVYVIPTLVVAGRSLTLGALDALVVTVVEGLGTVTVLTAVYRARRGLGRFLLPFATQVAGPLILLVPFLMILNAATRAGINSWRSLLWVAGPVALLLIQSVFGRNVRWSLHPYYREQLSTVFAVRRTRIEDGLDVEELPYEQPVLFSQLEMPGSSSPAHMPKLVVCAAVNISDPEVPPGRSAASFTFTGEHVGGPLTCYALTRHFERGSGVSVVTLPAMLAISGAAVAPSMGKMTRRDIRFLLTLFNVRLGVWLPNPLFIDRHVRRAERKGILGWLIRSWYEPGPLYLFYELLGRNNLDRDYIYITDGGHWDNLGLVELLRRGCTEILCFDASGDPDSSFKVLGEAIALARSELRVEFDIDVSDLRPDPETGLSRSDHVTATFAYPNQTRGDLLYVKATLTEDMPFDAHVYRQVDKRFPNHSTGDQFFNDQQFASYHALGSHAGRNAARHLTDIRRARGTTESPQRSPGDHPSLSRYEPRS
ncbi:MAG: hypothetical protein M3O70_07500 [Actinomycetota bacterium]|nr:hypothetical protein [Actinomycetota bacterium]